MTEAGTTNALAIIGTNVPIITVPDLTTLPPDDLMAASKNVWKLGRAAHDAIVACFKEIMYRYDGRKSNCPTFANVQEAFASISVNYEAARKLVYRDTRKRELEAIASGLHLPPATTSTPTTTSIFNIGDGVTVSEGDGVIEHVHQTTGKLDVVLHGTEETVENVSPQDVTTLNGIAVIDGKVAKQKEHVLTAGELLIDAATGKKWTYADGKFSVSHVPTRNETKQDAIANLKAKREAARLHKEEEKKERKAEAARKDLAKIEGAKAKREAKVSAKAGHKKTNGTNVPRTFQWKLIQGSTDPKPYAVSNNKGEILSYYATEPEAVAEVERLTTKYKGQQKGLRKAEAARSDLDKTTEKERRSAEVKAKKEAKVRKQAEAEAARAKKLAAKDKKTEAATPRNGTAEPAKEARIGRHRGTLDAVETL